MREHCKQGSVHDKLCLNIVNKDQYMITMFEHCKQGSVRDKLCLNIVNKDQYVINYV